MGTNRQNCRHTDTQAIRVRNILRMILLSTATIILWISTMSFERPISAAFRIGQRAQRIFVPIRSSELEQSNVAEEPQQSADSNDLVVKLKEEATSPFRLFRQFLYGAMGAAGGLGTFTAGPQLIGALQNSGDVENAIKNLAIDVGGVIFAAILWKFENDNAVRKINVFREKQRIMDKKLSQSELKEREQELSLLPVEIQISEREENVTRVVSLSDLQLKGSQNVVILAGKADFVRDAVISARLEGPDAFSMKNVIVIPFSMDAEEPRDRPKGFGKQPELIEAPYIAKPKQVDSNKCLVNTRFIWLCDITSFVSLMFGKQYWRRSSPQPLSKVRRMRIRRASSYP